MSGLTVGLASIDRLSLEIDAQVSPKAALQAKRILPVIDLHHWMLVTLLLCNACAMEALPIFLDKMVPEVAAILLSVTAVLFFGEIIPQALCTGPKQLSIATFCCPIVKVLMWLTFPISWPLGKILDKLLGEHTIKRFDNDQLKHLILLHSQKALREIDAHSRPHGVTGLAADQANIIEGALTINTAKTVEVMTSIDNVDLVLSLDTVLDNTVLKQIQ